MKLTAVFLLAGIMTVSANAVSQQISFSGQQVSLETVIGSVEKQTSYVFMYTDQQLRTARPVTMKAVNVPVEKFLADVFRDQPLSFTIKGKSIFIATKPVPGVSFTELLIAVQDPVAGRILAADGKPLSGASVLVKNSKNSVMTDNEGNFRLQVKEGDVLVFSFVGYEPRELKVTASILEKAKQQSGIIPELTVQLSLSNSKLDEIQVIAYGTTTLRMNTGSVAKIKGEDIRRQPVDNPLLALGGRLPGVQIVQTNGLSGAPVSVLIRGKSSLGAANDPLYVIDGVPFAHSLTNVTLGNGIQVQTLGGLSSASFRTNPFVAINPSDIESIEVLKDADATAIYGSRGANGVILITTRKAKAGKMSVDFNFYTGWGRPTKLPEYMNTQQYITMRKEAFKNDNITPTASNATDLMVWDTTRYNNWSKLLMGNKAHSTDAQVRLSGGNQQTQFGLAAGFHRETPIFYGNMYNNRVSFRANVMHRSTDNKFQVSFNVGYNADKNSIVTTDLTQLLNTIPNAPAPFDEKGNLVWRDKGINFSNPMAYLFKTYLGKTDNLIGNINMRYNIAEGLQVRLDAGYTAMTLDQRTANPIKSQSPYSANLISSADFYNQTHKNWIVEPQAEYTKRWGRGKLQLLAGLSFQEQVNEGTTINASGYSNDDLMKTPGLASNKAVSNSYAKYHYAALFGRINYNWDSKYLINISARRDGSSRFGPGRQFGNFGAIGAGWIFSEENFMKNLHFLHFGKLRASMGITGNDRIGDYQYLASWSSSNAAVPYQGLGGLYPSRLYNPDFAWERNKKWEAAIELSFLEDKIFFSADYYLNRTDNQLTGLVLPSQVGFTSVQANRDAILQNTGWELMLNTTNIAKDKFSWKSSFNISFPKNKLIAYPGLEDTYYASVWSIGMPITINKSVPYLGVDPATGIHKLAGISIPKDQTSVNDMAMQYYGGLQNTFEYKGFTLDFFFHFVKQKGKSSILFQAPGSRVNQPVEMLARWQKPGDPTNVQKFSTTGEAVTTYSYYANYSDARIVDASYIRLRNVSLSYRFNKQIAQKIKAQDLRVYFQGQNLLTISPYEISDPETMSLSSMPPMRMLTVGLQVVF
ncbi:SusC/RagA family TonB-linked outer membrane protein [Pseudoflavitalea sp. G-6-1-2]|uniref:SusC/RagA family TonB-linked outer membrane protein n=1 Tax=Pseudoflavitalea sp. G-6-1-2 TaxID=2728841 RepID=UPI00146BEC64|nr:SusC/RagA family TonB-linked outer membrane protein [Pseudoflavitalea sp. G-6-1-2]NML23053.1 SusC/RagA family TonB-linked outer membrane protein [Pseudoflavitalea sp. G-6-1-2]